MAVPPGEKVSFTINVQTDVSDQVDLSVADVPEGWIASLRGEGFVVDGVQTTGNDPVELTLDVTVPEGPADRQRPGRRQRPIRRGPRLAPRSTSESKNRRRAGFV